MFTTLQTFEDPRLRNLLRGALANTNSLTRQKTINRARQLLTVRDATTFANIMYERELDEAYYGAAFPSSPRSIYRTPFRQATSLSTECAIQGARLHQYLDSLTNASIALGIINTAILSGDLNRAYHLCQQFLDDFGYSATLARKVTYITLLASSQDTQDSSCHTSLEPSDDLLRLFFSKGISRLYAQYLNLTIDICDKDIDCLETMRDHLRFLKDAATRASTFPPNFAMMRRILFPVSYDSILNPISLLYFSSSSAIDLLVDISTVSYCDEPLPPSLHELFSQPSFNSLRDNLQPQSESIDKFFALEHSQDPEQAAYRASSIFTEVAELSRWRRSIDYEFHCRDSVHRGTSPPPATYFPRQLRLADLCEPPLKSFCSLSKFDNSACSTFLRTVAVLHCLRTGDRLPNLTAEQIRLLLSQTTGFYRLLDTQELLELKEYGRAQNSDVVVFLAMVMLNQKEPSEDLAYELRMAFQTVVMNLYNSDIIEFLDWLNERTASLCPVVVDLCDISFLEKLYLLNSTYAAVLSSRERICRWMASTFGLQEYEAAADRLALDAKVRRIRKGIDEARIFVDDLRYKQWALDAVAPILRKFERVVSVAAAAMDDVPRPVRKTGSSQEAPVASWDFWFYAASERAFKEFCHNKLFGIDSYLSRRIRHGTLAGTLVIPIQRRIAEFQETQPAITPGDNQHIQEILKAYENIVEMIRDDLLHFRTKDKPHGLFVDHTGRTKARAHIEADFRNRLVEFFQGGVSATELCPLLLDHCWDLLTEDLYRIQDGIRMVFAAQVRPLLRGIARGKSDTAWRSLAADLDQTAERVFTNLLRWFGKSEGSAMTVGVRELVAVVVQEVAQYFPSYAQRYRFVTGGHQNMSGLTYQTVYDVLSVIFMNIAQHGDRSQESLLWCEFIDLEVAGTAMLKVRVGSQNQPWSSDKQVEEAIRDALDNGDHEESMVREGKSGLGKAQTIVRGYSEKGEFTWNVQGGWTHVEFRIPVIVVRS